MGGAEATFPAADAVKELNPGLNKNFEVDPVSAQVATSSQIKEQTEAAELRKDEEKKEALHSLKSAILVSGVIVAVAGAVLAIVKKQKDK